MNHRKNPTCVITTAKVDNTSVVVRLRVKFPYRLHQGDYPYLLKITWNYASQDEDAMPTDETIMKMEKFEKFFELLERECLSVLVLTFTGGGQRVWHCYVRDPDFVLKRLTQWLPKDRRFPVQYEHVYQSCWTLYQNWRKHIDKRVEAAS